MNKFVIELEESYIKIWTNCRRKTRHDLIECIWKIVKSTSSPLLHEYFSTLVEHIHLLSLRGVAEAVILGVSDRAGSTLQRSWAYLILEHRPSQFSSIGVVPFHSQYSQEYWSRVGKHVKLEVIEGVWIIASPINKIYRIDGQVAYSILSEVPALECASSKELRWAVRGVFDPRRVVETVNLSDVSKPALGLMYVVDAGSGWALRHGSDVIELSSSNLILRLSNRYFIDKGGSCVSLIILPTSEGGVRGYALARFNCRCRESMPSFFLPLSAFRCVSGSEVASSMGRIEETILRSFYRRQAETLLRKDIGPEGGKSLRDVLTDLYNRLERAVKIDDAIISRYGAEVVKAWGEYLIESGRIAELCNVAARV